MENIFNIKFYFQEKTDEQFKEIIENRKLWMKKLFPVFILDLILSSCKIYFTHPRNLVIMDLFWFIIISLAILCFRG